MGHESGLRYLFTVYLEADYLTALSFLHLLNIELPPCEAVINKVTYVKHLEHCLTHAE